MCQWRCRHEHKLIFVYSKESLSVVHMHVEARAILPFFRTKRAFMTYLASVEGTLGGQDKATGTAAEVSCDNIVLTENPARRKRSLKSRLVVLLKRRKD